MAEDSTKRGGWRETQEGHEVWEGEYRWTETHGRSLVEFLFERPWKVTGAVHRGELVDCERSGPGNNASWRISDGKGGWTHGRIEISDDGVAFLDDPAAEAAAKPDPAENPVSEMQRDLARDEAFMVRLQDDAFADEVYASFCNREWRRADGERHFISWRTSGRVVAELRGRGETYIDWYPYASDSSGPLKAEVEAHYRRLGWTELSEADAAADREAALRLLEEIEQRKEGEARHLPFADRYEGRVDPYARLQHAWRTGRATDCEQRWISDRLFSTGLPEKLPPEEGKASA